MKSILRIKFLKSGQAFLFMINLKFEEEETKSLKVYEAVPGISMMQGNLHNATVNDEMSNTV